MILYERDDLPPLTLADLEAIGARVDAMLADPWANRRLTARAIERAVGTCDLLLAHGGPTVGIGRRIERLRRQHRAEVLATVRPTSTTEDR